MTRSSLGWAAALVATILTHGVAAQGTDQGIIAFTPSSARIDPLDTVALDVVLDFRARPALNGGMTFRWDPNEFEFVSWDISSSTIGGDVAFIDPGTLSAATGTLNDVTWGGPPAVTDGVMGTLTLRALPTITSICQADVDILPSASNPWIDAGTANFLFPTLRRGRIGIGGAICSSPPLAEDVADMGARCIGILPEMPLNGASCPNPAPLDWTVARLFRNLTINPAQGVQEPLADHMARYCVYERTGITRPPAGPDCRVLAVDIERVRPGMILQSASMAAAVQGGDMPLSDMLKGPLQNQFQDQAGFNALQLDVSGGGRVKLAIVDTMEFSFNDVSASSQGGATRPTHGDALRRFSQAPGSGILVDEQSIVGLPFKCFTEETCIELCGSLTGCPDQSGTATGFLGSPESVARGIHNAVSEWSEDRTNNPPRLVINASVGWLPQFNTSNGEQRAGYRALLDSLEEASCLGALVFAAAGNEQSGPNASNGLLSPATAGVIPAPKLDDCVQLGYDPNPNDFDGPRALLYPVSAVDAADQPLLTRFGGEPPLVAYGDHATQLGPAFTGGTLPTLTGSSVASVVVAMSAAFAWTADRSLPPAKLMEQLRGASKPLGRTPDVCLSDMPCTNGVRRVTVCETYKAACIEAGLDNCPVCTTALPIQLDLGDDALDDLEAAFDNAQTRTISFAGYQQFNDVALSECNGPLPYRYYQSPTAPAPLNPCPQDQYYSTLETPWATGQPEHQSCENCSMTERSPGKMMIEIRADFGSEFKDPTLFDATLLCRNRATGQVNAFRLPDTDPDDSTRRGYFPGERVYITNIDNDLCPGDDLRLAFSADALDADNEFAPASLIQNLLVIRHDEDDDAVPDFRDNCILAADPTQRDTDGDGIGNACDTDIAQPNDCIVNVLDLALVRIAFFSIPGDANWNPDADFNGDDVINFLDLGIMRSMFFGTPGPSAQDNACQT
ncbi:MAG: S8 family serine peptidase [Gammaproteobacteria bacterium]